MGQGDEGLEQSPKTPRETAFLDTSAAYALQLAEKDPRFQTILTRWPRLSDDVKMELLRIVKGEGSKTQ